MSDPLAAKLEENLVSVKTESQVPRQRRFADFSIYLKALLHVYTPKLLAVLTFILTIILDNMLGLFLLTVLILSMVIDVKTHWNNTWIAISVTTVLIMAAQIAFTFPSVTNLLLEDEIVWIGLGSRTKEIVGVFGWCCGLLVLCGLVGWTQKWDKYHMTNEEFHKIEEQYKSFVRVSQRMSKSRMSKDEPGSPNEGQFDVSSPEYKAFQAIRPYFKIKKFIRGFRTFYHRHGYELSLFFLVVSAFCRLNILSALYIIIATSLSFCTHFFNSREKYWLNRLRILRRIWRIIYVLLSIDMVRQYFFLLWFPGTWNINKPLSSWSFSCDPNATVVKPGNSKSDYEICVTNYKSWFSLDSFTNEALAANFGTLFLMISFDNYFYPLKEESERNYIAGDKNDFTARDRTDLLSTLKYFVFCYSYKAFLGVFVLAGIMGNVTGTKADLISVFYVVLGVLLLYGSKSILKRKNQLWKIIEIVNCAVLIAFLVYDAPFFGCPINVQGWEYYTNAECLYYQATPPNVVLSNTFFDKLILLVGLNKTTVSQVFSSSKMLSLMFFFLFSILQRRIWNHVYMKAYVEPYLNREIALRERRGIHYVEKTHIQRINVFRNLLLRKSLLKASEEEIDKKVKLWEEITQGSNVELRDVSRNSPTLQEDPRKIACLKKIAPQLAENITIMYDDLLMYMHECDYNPEETLKRVRLECKLLKHQLKAELHHIPKIGLPPLRSESLASIEAAELKHKEIIHKMASSGEKKSLRSPSKVDLELSAPEKLQSPEVAEKNMESPEVAHKKTESSEAEKKHTESTEAEKKNTEAAVEIQLNKDNIDSDEEEKKLEGSKVKVWFWEVKMRVIEEIKECFSLNEDAKNLNADTSIVYLVFYYILTYWVEIAYIILLLRFVLSPNILTFFPALGVFCYAAVEYPVPSTYYWKTAMWYTIIVIFAKFTIQLPFFCGGIASGITLYFGNEPGCQPGPNYPLQTNIDKIIGLYKFSTQSSTQTSSTQPDRIIWGLLPDFLTLVALMISRFVLKKRGIWHHVALTNDPVYVPQFKKHSEDLKSSIMSEEQSFRHSREKRKFCARVKKTLKNFTWNLFPYNISNEEVSQFNSVKKPGRDYYNSSTVMSIIILVFLVLFFTSMDGSGISLSESLQQSSFSGGMVLAVVVTFILMLVDRTLYVSKEDFLSEQLRSESKTFWKLFTYSSGKKVILHYALTILLMGYVLIKLIYAVNTPSVPYISFFFGLVAIYLYYSALQVKYGYPLLTNTHAFNSYDLITSLSYRVFRAIPFLHELGSILDWTVTKTSLDLYQWMKVEDAWGYLYDKEVDNQSKKQHKFGEPRNMVEKCSMGGSFVLVILLVIVGPLVVFSGLNPSTVFNNVYSGQITLSFYAGKGSAATYPIFTLSNLLITQIPNNTYDTATSHYFTNLGKTDIQKAQKIQLNSFPDTFWDISPPSIQKLTTDLQNSSLTFYLNFDFQLTRPLPVGKETVSGSNAIYLDTKQKNEIAAMMNSSNSSNGSTNSFQIKNLFPNFLKLNALSTISFLQPPAATGYSYTCDGVLQYYDEDGTKYWEIIQPNSSAQGAKSRQQLKLDDSQDGTPVSFYTYSEAVQGVVFGTNLGNLGIITIYATFVLAIGRIIRGLFDKLSQRVIYEEMPDPSELRELIEAISQARVEEKFEKEQQLYELFIRIYRSPEVLMKITGRVQKYADDDEFTGDRTVLRKDSEDEGHAGYKAIQIPENPAEAKPQDGSSSEDEPRSKSTNFRKMVRKLSKKVNTPYRPIMIPRSIVEEEQEEEKVNEDSKEEENNQK